MKAVTQDMVTTERMFACPECGSMEHRYGHLGSSKSFGPWYCDRCGCGVTGTVTDEGIDLELHDTRKADTLVLLRLDVPASERGPIHIVVKGLTFYKTGEQPNPDIEGDQYFYNEHTCPWNYLRLPIKEGDDCDRHGLFEHQETILMPEGYDDDIDNDIKAWRELFPSLREGDAV